MRCIFISQLCYEKCETTAKNCACMYVQGKVDIKLGIKDVPENCDNCQCTMMMSQNASQ